MMLRVETHPSKESAVSVGCARLAPDQRVLLASSARGRDVLCRRLGDAPERGKAHCALRSSSIGGLVTDGSSRDLRRKASLATFHLIHGRPEELLWSCHLGAALVGVGLLCSSATTNGIGLLFLCMGTPLWLMDLAGGGEFYPTSCFTHLGGLAIGLYGARRLGMPSSAWWKAVVALVTLILVCRLVTPQRANVNVAFAIYPGLEKVFPNHPVYLVTMLSLATQIK